MLRRLFGPSYMVLGGILANLRHATYATANLDMNAEGARLRLVTPHQRDWEAPIFFNFSPTRAFMGDQVVFSSSLTLAKELVMQEQPRESPLNSSNTAVTLDASLLYTLFAANRSQLVASNMLSTGQSQESAEAEIGLLLELITFLKRCAAQT